MMLLKIVVWCAYLFLLDCIPGLDLVSARQRSGFPLLQARCEAACDNEKCMEECLHNVKSNPGECPKITSVFESACINECVNDIQCPDIKKCCANSCGITCQTPVGLQNQNELPLPPTNVTVREIRKNRSAQLTWSFTPNEENEKVVFVIEQCTHPGLHFSPANLGAWTSRLRTRRTSTVVKDLRPGNWYLFRVASVNKNGTKGFSQPNRPFTLAEGPKPPEPPKNLRVVNIGLVNGSLFAELLWDPPQSDLPIQRYKVYWSLRLLPGPPPSPLLVRHKNVPHGKTSFILKKLKPDAEYFLQVEAYSQFGKERLKGEKESLAFNTTDYKDGSIMRNSGRLVIKKLWVKKENGKLKARIMWTGTKYTAGSVPKFIVSWKTKASCKGEKTEISSTTHDTYFELFGLQPACKYSVNVKEIGLGYTRSKGIYISTPA